MRELQDTGHNCVHGLINHGLSVGLPDPIQLSLMFQTLLHLDMSHNIIDHIHTSTFICSFYYYGNCLRSYFTNTRHAPTSGREWF